MLRCVALVRTDVSEEVLSSSETSVLIRATKRNIPENTILHSHCRENLKSYMLEHLSLVQWHGQTQIMLTFKADLTAGFAEDGLFCFLLKEERNRPASKSSMS
jgi:hypothetical protein